MKTFFAANFIVVFLIIAIINNASGQDSCGIFNNLKFKNGKDTVLIKAYYDELFKSPDYVILKKMDKEGKLKYSDYGDDNGEEDASACIGFFPENCNRIYSATINKHIKVNVNNLKHGVPIYLTCVVFEGTIMGIPNYYVITDIKIKADYHDPHPPVKNKKYLNAINIPNAKHSTLSYFSFADWPISSGMNVLVIDADGKASIKFNKSLIYFNRTSRIKKANGYTDHYLNHNYGLILTIDTVKKNIKHNSIRAGTLEVLSKKGNILFPVHGVDQEHDSYNNY